MALSDTLRPDANTIGSLMAMLALLLASFLLLRRYQHKMNARRDVTRETLAQARQQRPVRESADGLLIELESAGRRIIAELDTRFVRLETVIEDADRRIERLKTLLADAAAPEDSLRPAIAAQPAAAEGGETATAGPALPAPSRENAPHSDLDDMQRTNAEEPAVQRAPDPRIHCIYELSDGGKRPIEIAEALQMPLGEVELALNLRYFR